VQIACEGKGRSVPAATQRLDEEHAGIHATSLDIQIVSRVREGGGLRGQDLKIGVSPFAIAVRDKLQSFPGGSVFPRWRACGT
jgi:hypothetical protein